MSVTTFLLIHIVYLIQFCNYVCAVYAATGEFGRVYKGTWVHVTTDGNTVSEVVAVKTIKSIYLIHDHEYFAHLPIH